MGIRETLRAAGQPQLTLVGWRIGGVLCAMHAALAADQRVRNLALLTTPVDTDGSLYAHWLRRDSYDVDAVTEGLPAMPGAWIDVANKMMKPVTNFWTTYRQLWDDVQKSSLSSTMKRWLRARRCRARRRTAARRGDGGHGNLPVGGHRISP